jgi:hypothetical protein
LDNQKPYGFTISIKGITASETIVLSAYTKYNLQNAYLVASAPKGNHFYFAITVSDTINASAWKYMEMKVPNIQNMPPEITFYA